MKSLADIDTKKLTPVPKRSPYRLYKESSTAYFDLGEIVKFSGVVRDAAGNEIVVEFNTEQDIK